MTERGRDVVPTIGRIRLEAACDPAGFARTVAIVARDLARETPAPRGLPFFRLDFPSGCGPDLLEDLAEPGYFRHYERVLDLSSSFGAPARWLAEKRGCRVVVLEATAIRARASRHLTERARIEDRVQFTSGRLEALPFGGERFTRTWAVSFNGSGLALDRFAGEVHRVLRPGGIVALQVGCEDPGDESLTSLRSAFTEAGLVLEKERDVTGARQPDPSETLLAWDRLAQAWEVDRNFRAGTAPPPEPRRIVHVFARRPTT